MAQLLWLALAWFAGTAAILGSLMTLGVLLLWLVPPRSKARKASESQPATSPVISWQNHLKLLIAAVMTAAIGLFLLTAAPFPHFGTTGS